MLLADASQQMAIMARSTGCGDASHYDFLARSRAFGFKMIGWVGKVGREGGAWRVGHLHLYPSEPARICFDLVTARNSTVAEAVGTLFDAASGLFLASDALETVRRLSSAAIPRPP